MKETLIVLIRNNRFIYAIYYYLMTFLVNVLKIFVKTDPNLILFVSFGGRYFNDSPKCLYDAMKKDTRFQNCRLVWGFREPDAFKDVKEKVKIDTLNYYITALKARCWITNVHIERGVNFKGKHTFYLNTTHTILPKVTGTLIDRKNTFTSKGGSKCDCYTVQCEFERDILEVDNSLVQVIGYPKSDILANYTHEYYIQVRNKLRIPSGKKVILYAPTFREGKDRSVPLKVDFKKWEEVLGEDYIVLFRAHPVVACNLEIDSSNTFVKDVSSYSDNNDLIIASDILISDYSGIFFEFGVQDKPMFCYAYDYDEYIKIRPLYFDIRKELPGGFLNESDLLHYIKSGDRVEIMELVKSFKEKYITVYGNATSKCLDIIHSSIKK